ncbi:MAG: hypothetical protein U5K00_13715 [Melioribacteraceae bacterium]|nr:hypothetical protein [Melioribacteraceae bacterium]
MGDFGVATANDVSALYYNPALIADYTTPQLTFTHNAWIQDVNSENFGAKFKALGLPFALGVNTTSISEIEVRTTTRVKHNLLLMRTIFTEVFQPDFISRMKYQPVLL